MVTPESIVIRPAVKLCHDEASRLAALVSRTKAKTIILDMTGVTEATTPGLARLVLIRRSLLRSKRDFRLAGLNGQPARLLEVHRLQEILPVIHQIPAGTAMEPVSDLADQSAISNPSRCRRKDKPALLTVPASWPTVDEQLCCA
jgi:anti-anti-sigma regulatory factor